MEQAILERSVLHLHKVGKLELALEGARRDAAIEHFGCLAVLVGGFLALDRQGVFLGDDRDFILREAGDGDRNPEVVLTGALDVVGRIARRAVAVRLIEQRKQAVETDGGTIEGGEIESTHG